MISIFSPVFGEVYGIVLSSQKTERVNLLPLSQPWRRRRRRLLADELLLFGFAAIKADNS
jgi:hypothetical protein